MRQTDRQESSISTAQSDSKWFAAAGAANHWTGRQVSLLEGSSTTAIP